MNKLLGILLLASCVAHADMFPNGAFTEKAKGTAAAAFLKVNPSVRGAALADSLSMAASDPASGFHNPAAFNTSSSGPYFSMTSGLMPEDIVQGAVFYGHPYKGGKIFAGTHQVYQPSINLYDVFGTKTGTFRPWDASFVTGYAGMGRMIPWGASIQFLQSKIGPGISGNAVAVSAGAALPFGYFADRNLSMALAFSNLGTPMKIGSKDYPLPFRTQGHIGYRMTQVFFMNFDTFLQADQAPYISSSFEWKIPFVSTYSKEGEMPSQQEIETFFEEKPDFRGDPRYGLSLWGGVTTRNKTDSFADKLSFGLRMYLASLTLDAGAASFGNLGMQPRFNITVYF